MKKILTGMLALALFTFSANAQESGKIKYHKHHHGKEMMPEGLNLSATQKEQLKANRQSTRSQLQELNKNEEITVREYKTRKAAILKSEKEQFENVLTADQKHQLAQNKADRHAKHEQAVSKRLDKMKSRLNLSEEQLLKINADRKSGQEKATAIRENNQLSKAEKREQLAALRQAQKDNFKQLLTRDQIKKIAELKKDRMEKQSRK